MSGGPGRSGGRAWRAISPAYGPTLRRLRLSSRGEPAATARLMLLDSDGRLLASSDAKDAGRLGLPRTIPVWSRRCPARSSANRRAARPYAPRPMFWRPPLDADQQVAGVVRLSYPLTSVYERFHLLRYLIAGVLVVGLILGAITGVALALDLSRPIRNTTSAVEQLAFGHSPVPLAEQGSEEIRSLARSFNFLAARLHTLEESRSPAAGQPGARAGSTLGRITGGGAGPRRGRRRGSRFAPRASCGDGSANPPPAAPAG